MTLIGLGKYGLLFSFIFAYLPLAAIDAMPHHGMLGGLFVDLTPGAVFVVAIALAGATWSAMYAGGLLVNSIELNYDARGRAFRPLADIERNPSGYVPPWAELFFTVPVTRAQLVFFALLAVPGLWVVAYHSTRPVWAFAAAILGVAVAYINLILLSTPAAMVDPANPPLAGFPLADRFWGWLRDPRRSAIVRGVPKLSDWLWRRLSGLLWSARIRFALYRAPTPADPPRLYSTHFAALVMFGALLGVIFGIPAFLAPGAWAELPALLYLYVIVVLLVWTLTGLQFLVGRYRASTIVAIVVISVIGYQWLGTDHDYHVTHQPPNPLVSKPLTPVDVARRHGGGKNLVVVAASGGGILAAAWTTHVLENLIAERPELLKEIRLLSTISGGSVGAAYFMDTLNRGGSATEARVRAEEGSLEAAAYGFAFLDLPRLLTGGLLPLTDNDRGMMLEREWARTADGRVTDEIVRKARPRPPRASSAIDAPSMRSLRDAIREGRIPAPIFGVTMMESGRRLMITPIDFPRSTRGGRADTLPEFVGAADADMSLWTAARLSATFAFVSPAARAKTVGDPVKQPTEGAAAGHHLIDGGYYDNFGVTSALDWLHEVLRERERAASTLGFERVLVLQLRAFRRGAPEGLPPAHGALAALLGPLIGLEAIRDGVAASRNDIELVRFVDMWNARLTSRVVLCTVIIEPPPKARGPLSWHLTKQDKMNVKDAWIELVRESSLVQDIKSFLTPESPADCPPPSPARDVPRPL